MFISKNTFKSLLAGAALTFGAAVTLSAPAQATTTNYTYAGYDTDNDGYLEEVEYVRYSYDLIDRDDSGMIDSKEWDDYTSVWYDPYDVTYTGEFEYYDTDNDGFIEVSEYENAYDEDIYQAWDTDNDGFVEVEEYNTAASTYEEHDDEGLFDW